MADALWTVDPNAYVILEHFADPSEERVLANHGRSAGRPGMMLWSNMNSTYNEAAMGYLAGNTDFGRAYPPFNTYPLTGQVTYMESHDEQWLMFKTRTFGACSGAPAGGAVVQRPQRRRLQHAHACDGAPAAVARRGLLPDRARPEDALGVRRGRLRRRPRRVPRVHGLPCGHAAADGQEADPLGLRLDAPRRTRTARAPRSSRPARRSARSAGRSTRTGPRCSRSATATTSSARRRRSR